MILEVELFLLTSLRMGESVTNSFRHWLPLVVFPVLAPALVGLVKFVQTSKNSILPHSEKRWPSKMPLSVHV